MSENLSQSIVGIPQALRDFVLSRSRVRDAVLAAGGGLAVLGALGLGGSLPPSAWASGAAVSVLVGLGVYMTGRERPATDEQGLEPASPGLISRFVDALEDPAIFVDSSDRIAFANDAARKGLRIMRERPVLSVIIRRPGALEAIRSARASGDAQPFVLEGIDDLDSHYACLATPLAANDGLGVMVVMRDLTLAKRAERARADFLANASHELRTPLTSLSGFIETMRGPARDDSESWDRFLEIMHGQADRMRRLINDLMSLSRIELVEHVRPATDADLTAVVSEGCDVLEPIAREKGVRLAFNAPEAPIVLKGGRDELAQIVQNLLDNAIKYSEHGQNVEVELATGLAWEDAMAFAARSIPGAARLSMYSSRHKADARFAVLRVRDHGPGVPRESLPRLSERFFRVDPGRGLRRGTGLGLAICKHIVSRHGGDFVVESLEGKGTAFGVLLPLPGSGALQPDEQ